MPEQPVVKKKRQYAPPNYGVLMMLPGASVVINKPEAMKEGEVMAEIPNDLPTIPCLVVASGMPGTAEARAWIKKNVDKFKSGTTLRIVNMQEPVEIKTVEVKKLIL